jgi:hypothetical protein
MNMTNRTDTALDVWLRFDSPDDEESSAEANTYEDNGVYRVEWCLTAVGLVKTRSFITYEDAVAWLTAEGFQDFTS